MNTKALNDHKYISFLSFFLGMSPSKKNAYKKPYKLLMNENGNISADYSDPVVVQNIKMRMKDFENIPLSKDVKINVKKKVTEK